MSNLKRSVLICFCFLLLNACVYNRGEEFVPLGPPVSFNADIKPIIVQHCSVCHSESPTDPDQPGIPLFNATTGDYSSLRTYATSSHNADYSVLQARLRGIDGLARMPFSGTTTRDPLPDSLLNKIDRWIKQGASITN